MSYAVVIAGSAAATFFASLLLMRVPGAIATPVADRWHKLPTPLTGGWALLAGVAAGLTAAAVVGTVPASAAYVAIGGTGAFALGALDDRRKIGPRQKFGGQIAIGSLVAAAVHPPWRPTVAAIAFGAFVLVAAMNSFNFLDNIDGLAAGTAGIAAAALALISVFGFVSPAATSWVGFSTAGACVGFLPLNYRLRRPAALFMGDAGSHLLGLIVGSTALLAMAARNAGGAAAAAPLLILALPIVDTSLVIAVRVAERRPVWKGGRDHVSHRLVYLGLGERAAVAALLGFSAACAALGLLVAAVDDALVTGAAAGVAFAFGLSLGSRLALVTETQTEIAETLEVVPLPAGDGPIIAMPAADQPPARAAHPGAAAAPAAPELDLEPAAAEVHQRAHAQ